MTTNQLQLFNEAPSVTFNTSEDGALTKDSPTSKHVIITAWRAGQVPGQRMAQYSTFYLMLGVGVVARVSGRHWLSLSPRDAVSSRTHARTLECAPD